MPEYKLIVCRNIVRTESKHTPPQLNAQGDKQGRLVRLMKDDIAEHIIELKALEANPNCKELDVERWVQMILRSCLDFLATNGYFVRARDKKLHLT